ncbi:hypothetical protein [Kitasatospora kifunensis]|uniref:ATP synthase protein I n=1 Tax=Kitasatospora kifunensis TaxID=58351 RepID=A0A7W7R1H6_KITKI|nr:hypothetical protein [Kitasatospora kifunensis]MBB4923540.1 ATP synthase protein I [Kitasatospora kifunensis]
MPSADAPLVRGAAIPTAVAGVAAVAAATAVAGAKGLYGALFATLLVMAFFSFGQIAIDRLSRNNPQMMLPVAMVVYMTQVLAVGIVLALFKGTTLFDTKVFGFTVLGCTAVWTVFIVRTGMKAKIFYVVPESTGEPVVSTERQP